ncbi:MAG: hypothetical protein ACI4BC_10590 [Muribaculaceae bacterium]
MKKYFLQSKLLRFAHFCQKCEGGGGNGLIFSYLSKNRGRRSAPFHTKYSSQSEFQECYIFPGFFSAECLNGQNLCLFGAKIVFICFPSAVSNRNSAPYLLLPAEACLMM